MDESAEKSEITDIKQTRTGKRKAPKSAFKPGQSGNPNGRPVGSISLITILKKRLAEVSPDQRRTFAEVFVDNLIQDALDLDGPSRKLMIQYIEGMPRQQMTIETNKETIGDLTQFFRSVATGQPTPNPDPNESGGPKSA